MRTPDRRWALALALLGSAAQVQPPVSAPVQVPPPAPATPAPPPVAPIPLPVVGDAVNRASTLAAGGDCAGALKLLDPLVPGLTDQTRLPVQLSRLPCLAQVGRGREAAGTQAELAKLEPKNGPVRAFGVIFAVSEGRLADGADQLTALATDDPPALRLLSAPLWDTLAQGLTQAKDYQRRDRTGLALARANWQPADKPAIGVDLARYAVQALADQGRAAEAEPFLDMIDDPAALYDLGMERRFQPLWPSIELRLGPGGTQAADRYAARRLDSFASQPNDAEIRLDAIRAFVMLGRLGDAVQLGGQVPIDDGMTDDDVTAVLNQSQAMAASGDRTGAIARLRALSALDPAKVPAATSATVSLAETLDEAGQAQAALAAARAALTRNAGALSPWGKAWLKRTELCALSALGQKAEASAAADVLVASVGDNEAATIEGLLCAGQADRAAPIAIAALSTVEGAARIADQFQPSGAIYAAPPSRLRDLWTGFLARKDVKAAFDRRARILPRALWPAPGERPVPRTIDAKDTV